MRFLSLCIFFLFAAPLYAQIEEQEEPVELDSIPVVADPKYREDQFYATVAYNLVQAKPANYSQYSFSTSLGAGILRDMPVNKRRNHSVALGVGYSYSNIKHNLKVLGTDSKAGYEIADENDFDRNKLVLHHLEVPLELRWRNSDSLSHKFWRVYMGFKVSYLIYDKAQYEDANGTLKVRKDDNLNKLTYGAYLSTGWNTWNFYAYYGLTPIYDTAIIGDERNKMNSIKFGLIFYIL